MSGVARDRGGKGERAVAAWKERESLRCKIDRPVLILEPVRRGETFQRNYRGGFVRTSGGNLINYEQLGRSADVLSSRFSLTS